MYEYARRNAEYPMEYPSDSQWDAYDLNQLKNSWS